MSVILPGHILNERQQRELVRGANARNELILAQAVQVARSTDALAEARAAAGIRPEGPFRRKAVFTREFANRLRVRHGMHCLGDSQFVDWILERMPKLKLGYHGKRSVRVPGLKPESRRPETSPPGAGIIHAG